MALVIEIREQEILFLHTRVRMGGKIEVLNNFTIKIQGRMIDGEFDFENRQVNDVIRKEFQERQIVERHANVVINNSLSVSKQLTIPKMKKKQMINIARNELKLKLDLSFNFVVDIMQLESIEKNNIPYERVLAAAVKYNDIAKIEKWLSTLGIKIKSIQSGSSSILTLLSQRNVITIEEASLFIDVTPNYLRLYLFHGSTFLNSRTIGHSQTFEESWHRISTLVKMANEKVKSELATEVGEITLMGKEKDLKDMHQHLKKEFDLKCDYFDLNKILETKQKDTLGYLNALGGLL